MRNPPRFEVLIHEGERHEQKARVPLPIMPYPGLVILHKTGSWEVKKAQILVRDENSLAEKHDDPHLVVVVADKIESFFD